MHLFLMLCNKTHFLKKKHSSLAEKAEKQFDFFPVCFAIHPFIYPSCTPTSCDHCHYDSNDEDND